MLVCPSQLLGIGVTAAGSPTAFGITAAAWRILAGKWLGTIFGTALPNRKANGANDQRAKKTKCDG